MAVFPVTFSPWFATFSPQDYLYFYFFCLLCFAFCVCLFLCVCCLIILYVCGCCCCLVCVWCVLVVFVIVVFMEVVWLFLRVFWFLWCVFENCLTFKCFLLYSVQISDPWGCFVMLFFYSWFFWFLIIGLFLILGFGVGVFSCFCEYPQVLI